MIKDTTIKAPKLFMVLLGSKAPNRNVEQHDYFFGIASSIKELIPEMKAFWPEAGKSIHVDGWREVTKVDGFEINVVERNALLNTSDQKLFFINLGGYQANKLEEQHYTVLTVKAERALAIHHAKKTVFFKKNFIPGANSHIDEKYGVDVDDVHKIDDLLTKETTEKYSIVIKPNTDLVEDEIHLGYFKLDKL